MMILKKREPERLCRGKEYHKKIQTEWLDSAEGKVKKEKEITKPSGRNGRVDIFVKSDDELVAVVEIVRRNVNRQVNQIWDYIESQLKLKKEASPGIIFPERPRNLDRMNLIEQLFGEKGISVVWKDESTAERKVRS